VSGTPVFSTVHPDRVTAVAGAARVDRRVLLGRAMAHEIGHLLLNTPGHGKRGLMRARWSTRELRQDVEADWKFMESESAAMRATLATNIGKRNWR
jgi:predicted NBD/HSP70 family sugar kinase